MNHEGDSTKNTSQASMRCMPDERENARDGVICRLNKHILRNALYPYLFGYEAVSFLDNHPMRSRPASMDRYILPIDPPPTVTGIAFAKRYRRSIT